MDLIAYKYLIGMNWFLKQHLKVKRHTSAQPSQRSAYYTNNYL